jgi:Putative GTPase activating protein for Arf
MDFGVFVCSSCSGIHRDMTHKVKGIGMCNFNDKEIETLTKNGNENAQKTLMASYSAKLYPEPDKRDAAKMKEFFTLKYKQRRFEKKGDSSDSEECDDDKKKKKSHKKEEKKKSKK